MTIDPTAKDVSGRPRVTLVGAGPGDPELLTLKAHRALETADVVFFDELVAPEIIDRLPPQVEKVYVGKPHQAAAISQTEIIALLITAARAGRTVVRLKGGDPAIFARAGEEAEALRAAGIDVEFIAGVTAASAAAAAAGIPLTHRDHAQTVSFVTAVRRDGSLTDIAGLAGPGRTLVVYMGISQARALREALVKDGVAPELAVAVVENASRADQRVIVTTVGDLPETVRKEGVRSPAAFIIGEVVKVREPALVATIANLNQAPVWAQFAHG